MSILSAIAKKMIPMLGVILALSFFGVYSARAAESKNLKECGGVKTSIIECDEKGAENGDSIKQTGFWGILLLVLNILTGLVGIATVGGILYGALLYTTSSVSSEQTMRAKLLIRDIIIGFVVYTMMYLFLNFLIPGGILN